MNNIILLVWLTLSVIIMAGHTDDLGLSFSMRIVMRNNIIQTKRVGACYLMWLIHLNDIYIFIYIFIFIFLWCLTQNLKHEKTGVFVLSINVIKCGVINTSNMNAIKYIYCCKICVIQFKCSLVACYVLISCQRNSTPLDAIFCRLETVLDI